MPAESDNREMSFLEHLEELRWRLVKSAGAILLFSIVAYFFTDPILNFLTKDIDAVYFNAPTEAFSVRIKLSIIAGLLAALPVVFWQIWQFVVPGLYRSETRLVIPVVVMATLSFIGGAAFCFYLVLPVGMKFLLGFGTEKIQPLISIGRYISFVTWMCLGFGVVFELPIVSFFLGRIGLIDSGMLKRVRRYAVVGILVISAAITPSPDVFSQLMLAGPLYVLYELSIIIVRLTGRRG